MWEGRCSPSGDGKTEARNGGSIGPHLMVLGMQPKGDGKQVEEEVVAHWDSWHRCRRHSPGRESGEGEENGSLRGTSQEEGFLL